MSARKRFRIAREDLERRLKHWISESIPAEPIQGLRRPHANVFYQGSLNRLVRLPEGASTRAQNILRRAGFSARLIDAWEAGDDDLGEEPMQYVDLRLDWLAHYVATLALTAGDLGTAPGQNLPILSGYHDCLRFNRWLRDIAPILAERHRACATAHAINPRKGVISVMQQYLPPHILKEMASEPRF